MTGSAHFPDRNADKSAVLVKHKEKNLTTKTPRALSFTQKKQDVNWVFLGELGVLVVKHFKLAID